MITGSIKKNLGLSIKPAKRCAMNDPRTIPLDFRSVSMPGFIDGPSE
jgi:hypothetical protein